MKYLIYILTYRNICKEEIIIITKNLQWNLWFWGMRYIYYFHWPLSSSLSSSSTSLSIPKRNIPVKTADKLHRIRAFPYQQIGVVHHLSSLVGHYRKSVPRHYRFQAVQIIGMHDSNDNRAKKRISECFSSKMAIISVENLCLGFATVYKHF